MADTTPLPDNKVRPGYTFDRAGGLTGRERDVLQALLVGNLSMSGIGTRIGISKQRVHQLIKSLEAKGAVSRDGDQVTITVTINVAAG